MKRTVLTLIGALVIATLAGAANHFNNLGFLVDNTTGALVTVAYAGAVGTPHFNNKGWLVDDTGALVVTSTGSSSAGFDAITSATNTTAAMVVGTGASIAASGSGTIAATTAAALAANPSDCSTNQYATTIAASGNLTCSTWSINETPSGTVNSSNVTFTLAQTPVTGSVACYQNGLRVAPAGADYTLSGSTLTWAVAPTTGDTLMCDYRY